MKLSVLVISYARPDALERCLVSLTCQERLPDEIVLVTVLGDSATDAVTQHWQVAGTLPNLRRLKATQPAILEQENQALAQATGDIVCFIDDDAAALPDWLARLEAHYADERVGAVGGPDNMYDQGHLITGRPAAIGRVTWWGKVSGNHHIPGKQVLDVELLKGCNLSYRRRLVPQIDRHLIGQFAHHWELEVCLDIKAQGYRLVYDPSIRVNHYVQRSIGYRRQHFLSDDYLLMINHNHLFAVMKHAGTIQRPARCLWAFLWGGYPEFGLASWAWSSLRLMLAQRDAGLFGALYPALVGKTRALGTYRDYRRQLLG